LTENDGHVNDGPMCRVWNCRTRKWRTKMTAEREVQENKQSF